LGDAHLKTLTISALKMIVANLGGTTYSYEDILSTLNVVARLGNVRKNCG
jgi:hypothetical protein